MTEGKKDGRKKLVSRRDFLVAGGAVIAAGALSACTPKTETVTSTTAGTTKTVTVTNTVTNTVTSTATGTAATKTVTSTVTGTGATSTVTKTVPTTVTATGTATTTTAAKVVVFDPRGTPSPITLVPMAKRLDTLDGKTIYVIDINYPYTDVFCKEVAKILAEKYPKTTWIYRAKYGTYAEDDPTSWDLIQAKGHGMVVLVGH